MSWQRIDEHTSIDDTLVTCAEYQLFIDEMREQGKYFQPDHWTSYRYPEGIAREPILGVRHSDSVDFCEWLSQIESSEWNFRLPNQQETENYPLKLNSHKKFWYWRNDKASREMYSQPITKDNARAVLDIFEQDDIQQIAADYQFTDFLNTIVEHSVSLPLDIADSIRALSYIETTKSFDTHLDLPVIYSRNLNEFRTNPNPFEIFKDAFSWWKEKEYFILTNELEAELMLYLLVDLVTLQERIAGRSPAFEGIRLVKERIK